jgi:hypothetical protein
MKAVFLFGSLLRVDNIVDCGCCLWPGVRRGHAPPPFQVPVPVRRFYLGTFWPMLYVHYTCSSSDVISNVIGSLSSLSSLESEKKNYER